MDFKLEKNNSDDIGFASTCLIADILSFEEFKQWLYYVIEHADDVPTYFFDILDIKEKFDFTLKRHEVIGFTPSWQGSSDKEEDALDGIGYKRNSDFSSDASSKEAALKALSENPHIEQRFRDTFPFIEW